MIPSVKKKSYCKKNQEMLDLSTLCEESMISWGDEFKSHNDSGRYFFGEKNIDCQGIDSKLARM